MTTARGFGFSPGATVAQRSFSTVRNNLGGGKRRDKRKGKGIGPIKIDSMVVTGIQLGLLRVILWGCVGAVAWTTLWLMHDPWERFGIYLASNESPIWGYQSVANLPFVGGNLSKMMTTPAIFVSLIAMGLVTAIQVLALINAVNSKYLGLNAKWNGILATAASGAWGLELWVVLTEHRIYVGGWSGFYRDLIMRNVAIDRFSFGNIGSAGLLMFMAETVITICALFVISLRSSKLQKKFDQQAAQAFS